MTTDGPEANMPLFSSWRELAAVNLAVGEIVERVVKELDRAGPKTIRSFVGFSLQESDCTFFNILSSLDKIYEFGDGPLKVRFADAVVDELVAQTLPLHVAGEPKTTLSSAAVACPPVKRLYTEPVRLEIFNWFNKSKRAFAELEPGRSLEFDSAVHRSIKMAETYILLGDTASATAVINDGSQAAGDAQDYLGAAHLSALLAFAHNRVGFTDAAVDVFEQALSDFGSRGRPDASIVLAETLASRLIGTGGEGIGPLLDFAMHTSKWMRETYSDPVFGIPPQSIALRDRPTKPHPLGI